MGWTEQLGSDAANRGVVASPENNRTSNWYGKRDKGNKEK